MSVRRVLALSAAAAAVISVAAPACTDNGCEGDVVDKPYGEGSDEGTFVDEVTWESTILTSRWMDFPPGRTWKFHLPRWEGQGRPFVEMHGYVSPAAIPNQQVHCGADFCEPADNWTEGTGNIVEFSDVGVGHLRATNSTCSPFFLRLVLRAGPPLSEAGPADANAQSE